MNDFIAFNQALSDATRWRIVQLLFNEPLCVCELADILEMPQSSVSSHIQVIKKGGLLDSERCGKWLYYRVKENFRGLLATMSGFFETTPAADSLLKADSKRAAKRLAERNASCCPLPTELTKLKPLSSRTVTQPAR